MLYRCFAAYAAIYNFGNCAKTLSTYIHGRRHSTNAAAISTLVTYLMGLDNHRQITFLK